MSRHDDAIASWADAQTAWWHARRIRPRAAARVFAAVQARRPDIFLFDFADGEVTLRAKPPPPAAVPEPGLVWRAEQYLAFLQQVSRQAKLRHTGTLAMTMEDHVREVFPCPVFGFQKRAGSTQILLPDIDALRLNFYGDEPDDTLGYDDKTCAAVFVGATTGEIHDVDSIAALTSQRLRSGVFFRNSPDVHFRLPAIAQCTSPQAEQAIRELGFGTGASTWHAQLAYRFLISMDGNGATCSRVARALRSNSVLLKYDSPHLLYYFQGLTAGQHYLPIYRDHDVLAVIRAECAAPGMCQTVAQHGRSFFHNYLTRTPTLAYAAHVLERYFACFDPDLAEPPPDIAVPPEDDDTSGLIGTVHVAERGDLTGPATTGLGAPGSSLPIEGFCLAARPGLPIAYRAIGPGGPQPWQTGGALAGTKGQSRPLTGFAVRLLDPAARTHACTYWASFIDGSTAGPVSMGEDCASLQDVPLETIHIRITPR